MNFHIITTLNDLYLKYKDNKHKPIIRVNVETKFNSFNGLLEVGEYLIDGEYIRLQDSSCSNMGSLKINESIILVRDIISFAYTDFERKD